MLMSINKYINFATDSELSSFLTQENAKHPSFFFIEIFKQSKAEDFIKNVSFVSKELGISRKAYYDFLHGTTGLSPLMTLRLAAFFKKYIPDNKEACDYHYWWKLHSDWYFYNEIRKLCPKAEPLYTVSEISEFAADTDIYQV